MSRLDHDIERGLQQIADRATPSPDAWAQIQSRIADQEPIQETEIIMLTENTITTRRWPVVAAAAAVVALAITGIFLVNRGDGDTLPADDPPAPTVAPEPDPETAADEQQATAGDVSPLPAEGSALPPGRYAPFTLGLPVTFEVPEAATGWTVQVNDDVAVTIGPEGSFVNMSRLGSLYDAAEAEDSDFTGLGSIPPNDVDAWIEANGIIVDDSREITVGGRSAKLRQVRAPEGAGAQACPAEIQPCVRFSSASADLQDTWDLASVAAYGALPHSFLVVELDDFEPLGIWVHTDTGDPQSWFDEVQPLIDSIVLGAPAPATEFGQARISTFSEDSTGEGDGARALPRPGATIEPGRYTSDALGVPISFDLDVGQTAAWGLAMNEPGRLWINSNGSDQEFVAMGRLGSWYDATEARTEDTTGLGSIPPDDIDGWIAENGVIVLESADPEVGGRPAKYRRIRLDTTPGATADFCGASSPCLWASTGSPDVVGGTSAPLEVGFDRAQSIWLIDMDEFEPVYIFAAAQLGEDGDQQWFADVVQPIVDSIQFGEPAPVVPGGTARVPLRVTVSAPFSGVRTNVDRLEDGSISVVYEATIEGAITGEIVGTDTVIQGVPSTGHGEDTFTGTIEGIGTGTISWTTEWSASAPLDNEGTSIVTGGTGDFAGATGTRVLNLETSNSVDGVDTVTGTETFELAIPRSG